MKENDVSTIILLLALLQNVVSVTFSLFCELVRFFVWEKKLWFSKTKGKNLETKKCAFFSWLVDFFQLERGERSEKYLGTEFLILENIKNKH